MSFFNLSRIGFWSVTRFWSPLGRCPPSSLSSFTPKCCRTRSLRYKVAAVSQTQLTRSRKTLAPLGTILQRHAQEPRGFLDFFF
ncbi:hypothetical protein Zm00014a_014302 [Zea mays]|uniref:Uncharacterized protein n=1 Tax=Zea mays TaxID=4577 RepID=A0A3L6EIF6_MAIZE|nr:hypothetical protein Zm00014a_014302 [Zea mays]